MCSMRSTEKRDLVRNRMKDSLFAAIQGNYCDSPGWIIDLTRNGIGFYSVCEESELAGKLISLDLIADGDRVIMRSLSARLVYSTPENQFTSETPAGLKRYGLQFVNLSALEKRLLDLIINNYTLPD